MRTLLGASLAVLLVAAVTAQSSEPAQTHQGGIENIINKISLVINSLGGFEGAVDKLGYISQLVKKAYEDKGIGGWMARNLIQLELNHLKNKVVNAEKDMVNKLLDELEAKIGITTYSMVSAENYMLTDVVTRAIAHIRENIAEIITEINAAQREHDAAAGKIDAAVLEKLNEHIAALKEKLRNLSKRLLDKLTGRDKTAAVDTVGNYGMVIENNDSNVKLMSSTSYILDDLVKGLLEPVRERIFQLIEQIGEARREIRKSVGQNKKLALEHLAKLKEKLKLIKQDFMDALRGKKNAEDLKKDLEDKTL